MRVWYAKWLLKAAPRDSMRRACGITTSSATAAAMLKIWIGTTYPDLLHDPLVSECFANAKSSYGGFAVNALRITLLAKRYRSVQH